MYQATNTIMEYAHMFLLHSFVEKVAKKHLTQRIQALNDKVEKQNEISKDIQKNVSFSFLLKSCSSNI